MKNFIYGIKEHNAWLATDRTHEECTGCEFEYVMPPKCKGHAAGPTACSYKADYETCYDCRIGAACTHDLPPNIEYTPK